MARPRLSRRGFGDLAGFSFTQSLSGLAYTAYSNVDYAILGARMAAVDVGFFWRAYQLGVLYQSKISQIMLRVSFPVYSRTQGRANLLRLRMKIVRLHAIVIIPLLSAFVVVAPIAIPFIFGAAWEPAVVPAQIMAIAGIGHALLTGTGPLMVAIGRPGVLLVSNAGSFVVYGLLIYLLAPHGLIPVSIGVAAFAFLDVIVTQALILRPFVGLPHRQFIAEAVPGFIVGACVLVALTVLRLALDRVGLPAAVDLVVLAVVGAAVYVGAVRVLFKETWSDLMSILQRVGGRSRATLVTEPPVGPRAGQSPGPT